MNVEALALTIPADVAVKMFGLNKMCFPESRFLLVRCMCHKICLLLESRLNGLKSLNNEGRWSGYSQDPISWEMACDEYIDSLEQDEEIISFDNGSTYYWAHDFFRLLR